MHRLKPLQSGLLVLCLVMAACGPKPASPARTPAATPPMPSGDDASTVTITKKLPHVGLRRVSTTRSKMHFTLAGHDKKVKMKQVETEERHSEILAVRGSVITKLKVTFKRMKLIEAVAGKEKITTPRIEGKTFVIEAQGGKVVVTDELGKAAPPELADLVLKKYKSFGKPDPVHDALPTTPIRVGDKVEALATAIKQKFTRDFAGEKGKWSISGVSVSLKEVKQKGGHKIAVFNLAAKFTMKQGPRFFMTMNFKGTVQIRAQDGWDVATFLKGPLDIMGKKSVGEMEVVETIVYR